MKKDGQQGLALVSVLWCIALLSLIAAAMLRSGMVSVRTSHNAWDRLQAQSALDAGIERAVLALLQPGLDSNGQARTVPKRFSFDGFAMALSVQDQTGLLDLNLTSRQTLQSLLQSQGMALDEAGAVADAIIAWRAPGDRSHGLFQSVDELGALPGMTPGMVARLTPMLTVYSHRPEIDTLTAPPAVLQAVTGMDAAAAAAFVASREARPGSQVRSNTGRAFAIRAEARQGNNYYVRQAMVEITTDPAHPYWILDWK